MPCCGGRAGSRKPARASLHGGRQRAVYASHIRTSAGRCLTKAFLDAPFPAPFQPFLVFLQGFTRLPLRRLLFCGVPLRSFQALDLLSQPSRSFTRSLFVIWHGGFLDDAISIL